DGRMPDTISGVTFAPKARYMYGRKCRSAVKNLDRGAASIPVFGLVDSRDPNELDKRPLSEKRRTKPLRSFGRGLHVTRKIVCHPCRSEASILNARVETLQLSFSRVTAGERHSSQCSCGHDTSSTISASGRYGLSRG